VSALLLDDAELPGGIEGTVVTVGTFDGVHRGHLDVIARLVGEAARAKQPSLLITFEPHPLEVLNPAAAPLLLTTRGEKLAALAGTGVDYVAVVAFTAALAQYSAEEFVDRVLRSRFRMRELLIGHDHGFGRKREGDVELLRTLGAERGFRVDVVPPVATAEGEVVSSTLVRRAVAAGDLRAAEAGLGRPYSVRGEVVAGEARGRGLGFPTLNVLPESPRKLLPPDGVYAVEVATGGGRFGGMMNLGPRPTFDDARRTLEAHLFGADGDFYGQVVEVGFVARLRDTMKFDGPAALVAQLGRDETAARAALTPLVESANLKGSMHFPPSTP
jgi:riboflavin kinase/FMN adenylyltransferase